jgi:hypothetical protein
MKSICTTLVIALFAVASLFGQSVPRDKVVVEIGTGTWCQYCPGAAMGADDLISNGYDVAVVEYHNGDSYATSESNARISYYGITGFPTAFFDGVLSVVGGSNTQSMFPSYYPKVNQRMAINSPFSLDVTGTQACFSDITAHVTVQKVGTNSSTNLRLMAVITESDIEVSWQGQDKVDYVCRKMLPNQNGTVLDFSGGDTQSVDLTYSLDPSWVYENCELTVFVQDLNTKEIFQGTKLALLDFSPEYQYDAAVNKVQNLPSTTCNGVFTPVTTIRNLGSEDLTSMDIVYSVNNGEQQTYNWTGDLAYLETEDVTLPDISFPVDTDNQIVVETMNPDGNADECPSNDTYTGNVPEAMHTPGTVNLILRTDSNPGETTWQLMNSSGDVLYEGGPYTTAGQMVNETFDVSVEDCYTFVINDAGGDGLINPGFFLLYYGSNSTIAQGTDFGSQLDVEFNTADYVGIPEISHTQEVIVRPNPFSDKSEIQFTLEESSPVSLKIYNLTGQEVMTIDPGVMNKGLQTIKIDGSKLKPGLYMYSLTEGSIAYTGKLCVK